MSRIPPVKKHPIMNELEYAAHQARLEKMAKYCYAYRDRNHPRHWLFPAMETMPGSKQTACDEYNSGYVELVTGADRSRIYYYAIPRRVRAERPAHHKTTYHYDYNTLPIRGQRYD